MNPNSSQKEDEMLHPKLQAALTSLNIDLEEELTRFEQSQKPKNHSTISKVEAEDDASAVTSSNLEKSAIASDNHVEDHSQEETPQDYLQSSEELLRELNNSGNYNIESTVEESPEKTESSWRTYLLTPLGIAGILIFILSGTLLSLIFINVGEITSRQASTPTETADDESLSPSTEEQESTAESSSPPEIADRPNLANDHFAELNTDNLVEAESSPDAAPVETPSCGANFYCVMIENPSESEYNQTLQITGDGYMREFPEVGEVLQVGAFDTEARAEELLQRLEEQGISATIYKP